MAATCQGARRVPRRSSPSKSKVGDRRAAQARNSADAMVHSVKKSLAEHGDKIDADEKAKIEAALKDAEEALKSEDKAAIEAKTEALMTASQKLGEKVYAQAQAEAAAAGGAAGAATGAEAGAAPGASASAKPADENVVDAEFKEVHDKK